MPLSDLCLEISLYYCTKARTKSLPIYSLKGAKQFQMNKQLDRQGEKAQTIAEFSSFFNEVCRAICHFKPKWFDSHQAFRFKPKAHSFVRARFWFYILKERDIVYFKILKEAFQRYTRLFDECNKSFLFFKERDIVKFICNFP